MADPSATEASETHSTDPGQLNRHYVVCGLNALGLRLIEHLHDWGAQVVVVPGQSRPAYRAAVEALGVPIVEGRHDEEPALVRAGVERASAIALVADDDGGNLRGALLAGKRGHELRIIVRLFNEDLGKRIKALFKDCTILSQSAIAAPFFAAAALGEVDGERLALGGRALLVRRAPKEVDPQEQVVLPLVNLDDGEAELFPTRPEPGGQILVDLGPLESAPIGRMAPPARSQRSLRDDFWSVVATLRQLLDTRLRVVLAVLVSLLAGGTVYFSIAGNGLSLLNSFYFTVVTLSTVGYGDFNLQTEPAHVKLVGTVFIMVGATTIAIFFAVLTDTIVGARLAQILGGVRGRLRNHVIVCGLGNVGFRVVQRLAEQGVRLVAIERDQGSRHVAAARRMGVPVVIGDCTLSEPMIEAQVEAAKAVVVTTDNDVDDLETAVNARALHPSLRVVLRLFDHDLSTEIERHFDIHISRSSAVIAAPVFASEMLGSATVATVDVAGATLAFAEVDVLDGGPVAGRSVGDLEHSGDLRVLAISDTQGAEARWEVEQSRILAAGARIAVVGRPSVINGLEG